MLDNFEFVPGEAEDVPGEALEVPGAADAVVNATEDVPGAAAPEVPLQLLVFRLTE